jgi:putative endonuclease
MIYSQAPEKYYVYILLCKDKSYYTGLTDDLGRRLMQHEEGAFQDCYTYRRRPVHLEYFETIVLSENALNREEQIKKWSRAKKKALIESNYDRLHRLAACDNFTHYMYRDIREGQTEQ